MTKQQKIGLILGPALFAFILFLVPVQGELTEVGKKVLASMVWMIIWWSTQPVTLGQTALLPVLLFPALGLNDAGINATSGYVHTAVLLTTSVFWLGSAIEKWNLHRRIAFTILSVLGNQATINHDVFCICNRNYFNVDVQYSIHSHDDSYCSCIDNINW